MRARRGEARERERANLRIYLEWENDVSSKKDEAFFPSDIKAFHRNTEQRSVYSQWCQDEPERLWLIVNFIRERMREIGRERSLFWIDRHSYHFSNFTLSYTLSLKKTTRRSSFHLWDIFSLSFIVEASFSNLKFNQISRLLEAKQSNGETAKHFRY